MKRLEQMCVSYVCPEPVLVKSSFFICKRLKKDIFLPPAPSASASEPAAPCCSPSAAAPSFAQVVGQASVFQNQERKKRSLCCQLTRVLPCVCGHVCPEPVLVNDKEITRQDKC